MSERAEASGSAFWGDPGDGETLQRYRTLVNAVDDGIFQLDAEGRFVGVNDALVELTGHSRERLLGERASVLLDSDDRSPLEREVERWLGESGERDEPTSRESETFEVAVRTADGNRVRCELRLTLLVEDGSFRGIVGVLRDAAEGTPGERGVGGRGERERELERYEAIVEAVDDGVYVVDEDGRFTMVNEAYVELTGYSREELLGEHVSLVADEDVRRHAERIEASMRDGDTETKRIKAELETSSGERVPVEATFAMLPGSDGALRIGVVRDVTERRERERALEERERQLSTLIDNVPGMVYRCRNESDWPMEFVSDACREVAGYDPEALERGEVSWGADVMVDEDRAAVWEDVQTAVENRETFSVTYRIESEDGERRWVRSNGRGVFDDGDLDGVEGIISDVTERKRLEAELDEVFGRVTDAFYALDDEWQITHANERAEELIDYENEGLVGRNFWEVFEWATDSTLGEEYRTAMETQEPTSFEFYYPDPLDAWYEVHAYPSETGLSVYFRDVTERKERQRELEESERRYRTLVEHFPNGAVALVDRNLRYRTIGGSPVDDAAPPPEELEGRLVAEAVSPELADELVPQFEAALDGETGAFEFEDGDGVYQFQVVPVRDDDGTVFAALAMSQDVTERTEYERKLAESERRYRTLAEYFPNGLVTLFDRDFEYTLAAGRGFDRIPVEPDDLEGNHFRDVWNEDVASTLEPAFRAALDGEERSIELDYHGRKWILHAVPITDEHGDVFAGMTMAQDITEQKERERRLRRYREHTRAVLDAIDDVLYILDESGDLQRWNDSLCEVTGYRDEEVESMNALEFFDEESQDPIAGAIREGFETGSAQVEAEILTKTGDRIPFEFVASTLEDPEGNRVLAGIGRNVSERKRREQNLRDAKSQLEAAAEAGAVGTWEWHVPEDEFVTGASFARTFGVDPGAAREGVSLDRFVSAIHEADRERVERKIAEAVETCGDYEAEYRVRDADGDLRWVVARGHVECDDEGEPVTFPGAVADITERKRAERELEEHRRQLETLFEVLPVGVAVADEDGQFVEANETAKELWGGDVFDAEDVGDYGQYRGWWADTGEPVAPEEWTTARVLRGEEVTDPDVFEIEATGGERRIIMAHGMPVREDDGDVTRAVATLTDITERRKYQRQLEETVEKLEESNDRLESFASMLAHELRNPVTIGQIYSQQLPGASGSAAADSDASDGSPDAVEYVTEAFDRMEDIIDVMLVLTRGREAVGERSPVSVSDVARDAWDEVDASDATLAVDVDDVLQADETYVRHLFRNLFENAVQHGGAGVTVRVGASADGFYVADDGPGIPADERQAVFEAGFTTAGDEGGTGLGLAFVQKLADVYDWECEVVESDDGGARFEFRNVDLEPAG